MRTRTPVCEACTIDKGEECNEHREFGEKDSDSGCGGQEEESCACENTRGQPARK